MSGELEWQLEVSEVVQPELIPHDVVTISKTVSLVSVNSAAETTCTVVHLGDVNLVDDGISVPEPLGSRLIDCQVGVLVECEKQKDRGPWLVTEIIFQPERVGALYL